MTYHFETQPSPTNRTIPDTALTPSTAVLDENARLDRILDTLADDADWVA